MATVKSGGFKVSDGTIKTEFEIRTKVGETFTLHSFEERPNLVEKMVELLKNKSPIVFPAKAPDGRVVDFIFPYEIIVDIRVRDFSSLTVVKDKALADKRIQ